MSGFGDHNVADEQVICAINQPCTLPSHVEWVTSEISQYNGRVEQCAHLGGSTSLAVASLQARSRASSHSSSERVRLM